MGTINSVQGGRPRTNTLPLLIERKKSSGSEVSAKPSVPEIIVDPFHCSEQPLKLSPQQKQLIKDTWNHVDNKEEFTRTILLKVFKSIPVMKQAFDLVKVPDEQLNQNKVFNTYCENFGHFLNTAVTTFEHDEKGVIQLAKTIGAHHVIFCEGKNVRFDCEYLHLFCDIIADEFVNEQRKLGETFAETRMTGHIKTTWVILFEGLIETMRLSYCTAEQKNMQTK